MDDGKKNSVWPPRPDRWPEVMTDIELAMYLRLDESGHTPESAKRTLRYLRRNQGLPSVGRLARHVLSRRTTVDKWLDERERKRQGAAGPQTAGVRVGSESR